jgi:hypothetical protein
MSKTIEIDRRLLRRRREVAEGRARSHIARLGILLVIAAVAALIVWLFRSPLLAVQEIDIRGELPHMQLESETGVEIGQPLVTVRPGVIEERLQRDPWVMSADVSLAWPNRVVIKVEPRLPVAWVPSGSDWSVVGIDGVVLETATQPGGGMPRINVDRSRELDLLGGLEFAATLNPALLAGTQIELRGEELWGNVGGYEVRLGRSIDMADKARALNVVLTQTLVPGSVINLIAPARPAVIPPAGDGATDEGS